MGNRDGKETPGRKIAPMLRKEKEDPCADFWHTLKIGLPLAALLFLILPLLIR